MNLQLHTGAPEALSADALVLALFDGDSPAGPLLAEADALSGGVVGQVLKDGDFKAKAGKALTLYTPGAKVKKVVLIGLGEAAKVTLENLRNAAGKGTRTAQDLGVKHVALTLAGAAELGAEAAAQALAEGALMSLYQMTEYKTKDVEKKALETISVLAGSADAAGVQKGLDAGRILAESVDAARDLIVRPGNAIVPKTFAEKVRKVATEAGLAVEVHDSEWLEKNGFGGVLNVGKGSVNKPYFVVLEHRGGQPGEKPVAIVGKGITFDTGGISIKPSANMDKMKYDMAGGAAALGILRAAALLKLPLNVVGLIPMAENMPAGNALKPGDVITSYSGQTVEVLNTDAEGRLILMDALHYAVKDKQAAAVLDMATLTGAVLIALGNAVMGVMGNSQEFVDRVLASGEKAGDRGWQLPLWKEYNEMLKSEIADMKNIAGREAGTITAGCFLQRFVGDTPWVHLDIAGTAWTEKEKPYRPVGPTGHPIRAVVEVLRQWKPIAAPGTTF